MKNENFIAIQGWMINELGLKGNDLIVYALIYGFCQDGETRYKGSASYVASAIGVNKENARLILKRLCEKGLLKRYENIINGVTFCEYTTNRGTTLNSAVGYPCFNGGGTLDSGDSNIYSNIEEVNKNKKTRMREDNFSFDDLSDFEKLQIEIKEKWPNILKLPQQLAEEQYDWLLKVEHYTRKQITDCLAKMNNRPQLISRYASVPQTLLEWLKSSKKGQRNDIITL